MGKALQIELLIRQNKHLEDLVTANKDTINSLNLTINELRNTITYLNKTIVGLEAKIDELTVNLERKDSEVKGLEQMLISKDVNLEKAKAQMRSFKALYAPKQSEKQKPEAKPKTEEEIAAQKLARKEAAKARGNNGAKRKEYVVVNTIEKDVFPAGIEAGQYPIVGTTDVVRYCMTPPSFYKIIYHVHKVRKGDSLVAAKAPAAAIFNSNFDGSFIAGMAQLKYIYSMSVERIVKYFKENGFDICRPTAYSLLDKCSKILENLHKAMEIAVRESRYINCDETYHPVLNKDSKHSLKGYIWVITAQNKGLCYFFYDKGSRKQKVILDKLSGYVGVVQSDGLKAYKTLEKENEGIVKVACLQHCKRAFLDESLANNKDAKKVTELASMLYHKENQHKIGEKGWTVADNLAWRQKYAPPILAKLKAVLDKIVASKRYTPSSKIVKAANYFLNEWDGIEAISRYGDVCWDNNSVERLNRYISLSRHNSLFFGSHAGAERGCIYFSLACSCRMQGINFFDYLSDVLNKAAKLPPSAEISQYRALLPDQWAKNQNT